MLEHDPTLAWRLHESDDQTFGAAPRRTGELDFEDRDLLRGVEADAGKGDRLLRGCRARQS